MREYESLSHTEWDCKYHVVFIPKRRKKVIFGGIPKYLGKMLHELAVQKGCQIVEGHLMTEISALRAHRPSLLLTSEIHTYNNEGMDSLRF
jgi:hypothetical protein